MSQPESRMRAKFLRTLRRRGAYAIAVENPACAGTPDVWSTLGGWFELKQVPAPKDRASPVRVPKYTKQQRLWARQCLAAGGKCWLLLKVGREYFLLNGGVAATHVGTASLDTLENLSVAGYRTWSSFDKHIDIVLERYQ